MEAADRSKAQRSRTGLTARLLITSRNVTDRYRRQQTIAGSNPALSVDR